MKGRRGGADRMDGWMRKGQERIQGRREFKDKSEVMRIESMVRAKREMRWKVRMQRAAEERETGE